MPPKVHLPRQKSTKPGLEVNPFSIESLVRGGSFISCVRTIFLIINDF